MKITAMETHLIRVGCAQGAPSGSFAGAQWTRLDSLFLRVITDQGLEGWGEAFGHAACPITRTAIETMLAPAALGQDARDIRGLHQRLAQQFHLYGRNGPLTYALSALDIALWDIAGKAANLPLCRLLGAAPPAEGMAAYASLMRYQEPKAVAEAASRAVAAGYRHIKLHEIDVPQVAAAREAIGPDIALMLDTNCPWPVHRAIAMAKALARYNLSWLEEPVWPPEDHAGLARVRREGGIAIAAGENAAGRHDFLGQFALGALDIAQPSVTKIGGITPMLAIASLAAGHGVRLVPHCAYFGAGYLASLHLQAALAPDAPFERLFLNLEASPYHELIEAPGGRVKVPEGPGLGRDPDAEILRRFALAPPQLMKA